MTTPTLDGPPEPETDVGIRNFIFAAPRDDPRARRPADAAVLALAVIVTLGAAAAHSANNSTDRRVQAFFDDGLPGWVSGTLTIVYVFGGLYTVGLLLGIAIFARGRGAVVRDMLSAAALTAITAVALSWAAGPEWPDIFPAWFETNGRPSYPVFELSVAVAVVTVANPYLTVPMRRVGRRLLVGMAIAAVVMQYGTLSGAIGALALGTAAAAAIHLVFGSAAGIPSKARIRAVLTTCGIDTTAVEYLEHQPVGATLVRAQLGDGGRALVKVYGRDAADAASASRVWRSMWYRNNQHAIAATGLQLVEHESLMLLASERAHAPVPALLGWGRGQTGDSIVATEWSDAPRLSELEVAQIDDAQLDNMWQGLAQLHHAGIAHSAIDALAISVRASQIVFDDLAAASSSPDSSTRAADRAQLLVTSAVLVGREQAIAAAKRNVTSDDLAATLPLLQKAVLSTTLERDAHKAHLKLSDLRNELAAALGTKAPEPVQLTRVTWKNVAMIVLTGLAAFALITQLAEIGFDTLIDQLADADWAWILIAFVLAQLTNVGEYLSLAGIVDRPVPFGPTIMFRYAISFIGLAVPSDAGAIAMNVRYMQKLGVATPAALAQGPLLTVFSKVFDVILLLLSIRYVGPALDLEDVDPGPVLKLVVWIAIGVVIGAIVMFSVPKLRNRVVPPIMVGLRSVKDAMTDPERVLRVCAGTLLQKILFALALSSCVMAYGGGLNFGEAIFVNTAVSLLISFIPVPGGVGVGEAALTAGLTAVGIPTEVAAAAAITHRLLTSYLPPVFGAHSSRWLGDHDHL